MVCYFHVSEFCLPARITSFRTSKYHWTECSSYTLLCIHVNSIYAQEDLLFSTVYDSNDTDTSVSFKTYNTVCAAEQFSTLGILLQCHEAICSNLNWISLAHRCYEWNCIEILKPSKLLLWRVSNDRSYLINFISNSQGSLLPSDHYTTPSDKHHTTGLKNRTSRQGEYLRSNVRKMHKRSRKELQD